MSEQEKIIEELHAMNNFFRGFCENFDCGNLPCNECPIGPEVCLALGKRNLFLKYGRPNILRDHWKDFFIVISTLAFVARHFGWW